MNCVGIDVSKGKSTIAVMRPFGEVVVSPFEVCHTVSELSELARLLKSLDGETRVVMESTGNYHAPVAWLDVYKRQVPVCGQSGSVTPSERISFSLPTLTVCPSSTALIP